MDDCPYCKMPPCLTCGKCWCDHQPHGEPQLPGREEAREALGSLPETFVADVLMGGEWSDSSYVRLLSRIAQ